MPKGSQYLEALKDNELGGKKKKRKAHLKHQKCKLFFFFFQFSFPLQYGLATSSIYRGKLKFCTIHVIPESRTIRKRQLLQVSRLSYASWKPCKRLVVHVAMNNMIKNNSYPEIKDTNDQFR